ncbi:IS66 family insertion sequence element accessory protein TnpA [Frigoriglobus tundricola]|uniref:Uncharacterized protein n=1 Tax=Frigoriglobus tundricola TaxID=2774151 RepID=A0A6M5YIQ9_9BACT|nr:hypothetical protein FTUN_0716 [Frigoriglobus tundricola]
MSDSSPRSRCDAATRRWSERLERFAAGNHTVAAFCTTEGVSLSIFYLWRRRLTRPVPSPAAPALADTVRPLPTATIATGWHRNQSRSRPGASSRPVKHWVRTKRQWRAWRLAA